MLQKCKKKAPKRCRISVGVRRCTECGYDAADVYADRRHTARFLSQLWGLSLLSARRPGMNDEEKTKEQLIVECQQLSGILHKIEQDFNLLVSNIPAMVFKGFV